MNFHIMYFLKMQMVKKLIVLIQMISSFWLPFLGSSQLLQLVPSWNQPNSCNRTCQSHSKQYRVTIGVLTDFPFQFAPRFWYGKVRKECHSFSQTLSKLVHLLQNKINFTKFTKLPFKFCKTICSGESAFSELFCFLYLLTTNRSKKNLTSQ